MNFAENTCLFLAVAIENVTCLWFMREMVYRKERALKNMETVYLFIFVAGITGVEFVNRAYFAVFSETMLILKIFFLSGSVIAARKKRC